MKLPLFINRDLKLFIQSPREFLYSFTYSNTERVEILPYDERITQVGNRLYAQIKELLPDLELHFIGSSAMKIPGQKDIDFLAASEPKDFDKYLPSLIKVLGEPYKRKRNFIEWKLEIEGSNVDMVMCDRRNPIFKDPLQIFNILMNDEQLLKEYLDLKISANHSTEREYKKRRLVFFHKIKR